MTIDFEVLSSILEFGSTAHLILTNTISVATSQMSKDMNPTITKLTRRS
jgi:hypothetical protein